MKSFDKEQRDWINDELIGEIEEIYPSDSWGDMVEKKIRNRMRMVQDRKMGEVRYETTHND